jgi:hypothetical protein
MPAMKYILAVILAVLFALGILELGWVDGEPLIWCAGSAVFAALYISVFQRERAPTRELMGGGNWAVALITGIIAWAMGALGSDDLGLAHDIVVAFSVAVFAVIITGFILVSMSERSPQQH